MDGNKMMKIFLDVYNSSTYKPHHNYCPTLKIEDNIRFENVLEDYLKNILGYGIISNYTAYYREIKTSFENIFLNAKVSDLANIEDYIIKYGESFWPKINEYEKSSIFINTMFKVLNEDLYGVTIKNVGDSYTIQRTSRKEEDALPEIYIRDIKHFEEVLNEFQKSLLTKENFFNRPFLNYPTETEALEYIYEWTIRNAGFIDLMDVEKYYEKYTSFVNDTTFDSFRKPLKVADLLGNELYIVLKRANVNYETPYYLTYYLNADGVANELPNIRLGIEDRIDKKVAHIIATQTAQGMMMGNKIDELNNLFKKLLSKSKYFREFNPSHVISLIITFGMLKASNIEDVYVVDYLPLRFRRLVLDNHKNYEEIERLQYRLTNKNLKNYFRLLEFFDGIEIVNYPDMDGNLHLRIGDDVTSSNAFLQDLYNIGYNSIEKAKQKKMN